MGRCKTLNPKPWLRVCFVSSPAFRGAKADSEAVLKEAIFASGNSKGRAETPENLDEVSSWASYQPQRGLFEEYPLIDLTWPLKTTGSSAEYEAPPSSSGWGGFRGVYGV